MSHSIDPIARAYAVIGLRPGASAEELKGRYRALAKSWHPDRWANDPVSAAEAAQRMRVINEAYATLHRAQTVDGLPQRPPKASPQAGEHSTPHAGEHWSTSHRSMTDDELDAVVCAIGTESSVAVALQVALRIVPFAAAVVLILPRGRGEFSVPPTTADVIVAAALFVTGLGVLLAQKLQRR